jgi:hypothetical protein
MISNDACHIMSDGEILNENHADYPIFDGTLYGDKVLTAKFSKRLSCAIKHLPIRVRFVYDHDIMSAIEHDIRYDPTFVMDTGSDEEFVMEGLVSAEDITQSFEEFLVKIQYLPTKSSPTNGARLSRYL